MIRVHDELRCNLALDVDHGPRGQWWLDPGLLALANGHNNRHAYRPGWEHVGEWHELQDKGRQQQWMEADQPHRQDHRRQVEQFIGKRPPERPQDQLEHIGRHRDDVSTPNAMLRQNR